tara:strand:+ start:43075 stop:43656 length:582 start_codon:yes stop_codon:yes gene_type:complete
VLDEYRPGGFRNLAAITNGFRTPCSRKEHIMSVAKSLVAEAPVKTAAPRAKAPKPTPKAKAKTAVPTPEPKAEAPKKEPKPEIKAEDRPLTLKARTFLKLLEKHPKGLTRKSLLEMSGFKSDAMSSYMGSTQGDKYKKWDAVARDPKNKSWNHISLLGRGYVTFKAGVQTPDQGKQTVFTITKSGLAAAKKIG